MQTLRFISPNAAIDYATKNPKSTKTHMLRGRLLIPLVNRGHKRDIIRSHSIKSQFGHENFDSQRVFIVGKIGYKN